jgi:dephospho-CoA kinase
MLLVGLTGGIGSGKSAVARMLADRGATVLDADAFAREAVDKGTPALDEVIERFGSRVIGPDGQLDRRALASIVFADEPARRDLEAIVHPHVARRMTEGIAAHAQGDEVVVLESPLLIEMGTNEICDVVVVVTASESLRVARLIARGMEEADVSARIAAQPEPSETAAAADVLLHNEGTLQDLEAEVDGLWDELEARAARPR